MANELIEQEKRELKTEGFKEAVEYFQSFRNIRDGINMLDKVWYELETGEMGPKNAKYILDSLYKTRNKARTIASCLEQKYGCWFLNRYLPEDDKLENFDNLLKIFDYYHSVLSRRVVKDLETMATAYGTAAVVARGVGV